MRTMFIVIALISTLLLIASFAWAETLILQPGPEGKDCYICDCSPNVNSPNGGTSVLWLGRYGNCFDRMLIQWDISALPAQATIDSAIMEGYLAEHYGTVSGQMVLYRIIEDWDETAVTYNTQPDTSHDVQLICDWPWDINQWYTLDITSFVQGWYNETLLNFGLYGFCENTTGSCDIQFYSSDNDSAQYHPKLTIYYTPQTSVRPVLNPVPGHFGLNACYPNPFNASAVVSFSIVKPSEVLLAVYDLQGREVSRLQNGWLASGVYQMQFNGMDLPSGTYLARLISGEAQATQKLMLVK
jgi:hypothetical protein